jgi:hypothetical protein
MAKDRRTPTQKCKPPAHAATKNPHLLYQARKIRANPSFKSHAAQNDFIPTAEPKHELKIEQPQQ